MSSRSNNGVYTLYNISNALGLSVCIVKSLRCIYMYIYIHILAQISH